MMQALKDAKDLLRDVTPLKSDCGLLCAHACCKADSDGQGGVELFPGEEDELSGVSWASIATIDGARVLMCEKMCSREIRPLGCMIFPLTPRVSAKGKWGVGLDSRANKMCPLYRYGARGLDAAFVENARKAVEIMSRDKTLNIFMLKWIDREREFKKACDEFAGGLNARD